MTRTTTTLIISALVIIAALLVCGCMGTTTMTPAGDLKKFNSTDEIKQYIRENTQTAQESGSWTTDGTIQSVRESVAVPASMPQGAAKSTADFSGITGTTDYSTTNVQVAGVDEPDFIKNDGRYIYLISGSRLVIVDAYPAQNADIISETEIEDNVKEIFISSFRQAILIFPSGP
ncbi:MAG: beta-propeller domain-containing protein [Methanoregula sp.]|nr:beta-propeller domain-containing protein [Methanoregula sp.]